MKILIVTVAGSATRFSKSIGREELKCLYTDGGIEKSLLYRLLTQFVDYDRFVIVGGYKYDLLKSTVEHQFGDLAKKVVFVNNGRFAEYGSGYSLYVGLKECLKSDFNELVFAEGDLFVDDAAIKTISDSKNNVITVNSEPITSDKSVVLYTDASSHVKYIYDTSHATLEIKEPFRAIHNSGQVWKFVGKQNVLRAFSNIAEEEWRGTNLVFINKYFSGLPESGYDIVRFGRWINCNTIDDYKRAWEE